MQAYEQYTELGLQLDDGVLRITLRGAPENYISPRAHKQLSKLFRQLAGDDDVKIAVITGEGEYAFSLGGEIAAMDDMIRNPGRWMESMAEAREIILGILDCDKPIIARINGHAIGLGATLALCCDISCMVDGAKIGDPHVKVGLAAGDGGAMLWAQLAGLVAARKHLLTGEPLKGAAAVAAGLVTETASRDDLDAHIDRWIQRLGSTSATALKFTKRALNADLRQRAHSAMDAMLGMQTLSYLGEDHRKYVAQAVSDS